MSQDSEEFIALLSDPDTIGFVFFKKDNGAVVSSGQIAGKYIITQDDNLLDAVSSVEALVKVFDEEIGKTHGAAIIGPPLGPDDLRAKHMALDAIEAQVRSNPNLTVAQVRLTPTSIEVVLSDGEYEGPWEWDTFPVRVSYV